MRTFIIEYTSKNKSGMCIICETDRRKAIKTFSSNEETEGCNIKSINEVKNRAGVIFNKANVSLS